MRDLDYLDPLDTPPRRPPLAPGHEFVSGFSRDGYPIAVRVPAAEAARLRRDAVQARERRALRRRAVDLFDSPDPHERAEAARLVADLNAEASNAWPAPLTERTPDALRHPAR